MVIVPVHNFDTLSLLWRFFVHLLRKQEFIWHPFKMVSEHQGVKETVRHTVGTAKDLKLEFCCMFARSHLLSVARTHCQAFLLPH